MICSRPCRPCTKNLTPEQKPTSSSWTRCCCSLFPTCDGGCPHVANQSSAATGKRWSAGKAVEMGLGASLWGRQSLSEAQLDPVALSGLDHLSWCWVQLDWLNGVKPLNPSSCPSPHWAADGTGRLALWTLVRLLVFLYLQANSTNGYGVRSFGVQTLLSNMCVL